jgi:UDPglucose 6-dehydrogenase
MTDKFEEFDKKVETTPSPNQVTKDNPLRLGIVGHGFVGKAVDYAFHHPLVEQTWVDPKYGTTVDDLIDREPDVVFIAAPTPMNPENGFVDASIVEDAVLKLARNTGALIVVKSTVTPDIVDRLSIALGEDVDRFVYNPEFLTERNADNDFLNAEFHVLGGTEKATKELEEIYRIFSAIAYPNFHHMTAPEASFVKYAINSYLSTKVIFFNQLKDLVDEWGCSYNVITRAVGEDDRIGIKHTRVPGPDRKKGFGGACFPKDTSALYKFSNEQFSLLKNVLTINQEYRTMYEVDEREKVNNITFEVK